VSGCVSLVYPAAIGAIVIGLVLALNLGAAADRFPKWLRGWGANNPVVLRVAGAAAAIAGAVALVTTHPGC